MKHKTLARHTAELIASELFSYGPQKAWRLVMELDAPVDGPGWIESAVVWKIEETLSRKHVRRKKALVKK